jgi:hypothetical protein
LLIKVGLQDPDIPFNEVNGKKGAVVPKQKSAMALKLGVTIGFTVMVKVAVDAHCPPLGVKV